MKTYFKNIFVKAFVAFTFSAAVVALSSCSPSQPDVILGENDQLYTMDNGIVRVSVAKASGDLVSLRYNGQEMLATLLTPEGEPDLRRDPPGANPEGLNKGMTDHQYGFWSHDAMGPKDTSKTTATTGMGHTHGYWSHDAEGPKGTGVPVCTITISPDKNGADRAEVSVKGISNGRKMGTGPGSGPDGQFVSDIEIRYTLGRGDSGVYTYCIFEHKPEYPLTQLGEARFATKLAEFFDWMSVDSLRNLHYPKDLHAGDKYIYTALQSANPAFGWSSTSKNVGLFFINPSMEYISGGPTKVEFLGHRDTNPVAAPTILNYWRSSHYGAAEVNVAAGEDWKKVVGPFFIYVNTGTDPQAIYADAKAKAKVEAAKWPFDWVNGVDYPHSNERARVSGRLVLNDPQAAPKEFSNLNVGLTAPAYVSPRPEGAPQVITDWQRDAKNYQFWTKGNQDGTFEIANVRPGTYTMHAFADGVLGEYVAKDVVVSAGKPLDLGKIDWVPIRHGKQLWEVGVPNRNASEFFKANEHDDPEISIKYAQLFPQDVTFTIGKSDVAKDWFFQHVPHNEDPQAKSSPYFGVRTPGKATPYTVVFDMAGTPAGKATLRFAVCGTGTKTLEVSVNGKPAGMLEELPSDGVITRHGTQGLWYECDFAFDASLMKQGQNTLTLTVPAGPINNGLMYDYIRLELDEASSVN